MDDSLRAQPHSSDLALARLEGKLDTLKATMEERLNALSHAIEFGDRSSLQVVQIVSDTQSRLEANQREQGKALRDLDALPREVEALRTRVGFVEGGMVRLQQDRAKLIGFFLGAAAVGGGIGGVVAQALGG